MQVLKGSAEEKALVKRYTTQLIEQLTFALDATGF